jgi:serine phosphatase RsbU (regulator of sigma subunit)
VLGNVVVWRIDQDLPFDARDSELLSEITSRAALMIDNARRYTREHRSAAALQQQMLPRAVRNTPAAQTLGSYVPAGGGAGIGGDWFDVIPLPSLRVALVVGDVIGHGLHATATMGRLRAAVRTLADLELAPDELLTRMDDLVQRLAEEADADHRDTIGATCLYAVYDPVSGRCAIASAGHPAPALIRPDGTGGPVGLTPGPILGVGGLPFEITDIPLTPGSLLALYTDGLTERLGADPDDVARLLASAITASAPVEPPPLERLSEALVATAEDPPPRDDVTLLLARTRALPEGAVAVWEYPAEEPVVAQARKAVTRQLSAWGLDELVPETQLIVSELITNAIRYAGGPIQVRLIRESVLVCEVSDPSNTQPRLRRAHITDENGRGLFLIAHMARRWGSRYGVSGKTIWVEQSLPEAADGQDTET